MFFGALRMSCAGSTVLAFWQLAVWPQLRQPGLSVNSGGRGSRSKTGTMNSRGSKKNGEYVKQDKQDTGQTDVRAVYQGVQSKHYHNLRSPTRHAVENVPMIVSRNEGAYRGRCDTDRDRGGVATTRRSRLARYRRKDGENLHEGGRRSSREEAWNTTSVDPVGLLRNARARATTAKGSHHRGEAYLALVEDAGAA